MDMIFAIFGGGESESTQLDEQRPLLVTAGCPRKHLYNSYLASSPHQIRPSNVCKWPWNGVPCRKETTITTHFIFIFNSENYCVKHNDPF